MPPVIIDVTAAVIVKDDRICCARRAAHKEHAGYWEFPGGKLELGETLEQCLVRELAEELAIEVRVERFLLTSRHRYPDKIIDLHAFQVRWLCGDFNCVDHDLIRWLPLSELQQLPWSAADIPIIDHLLAQTIG
ncbi:(deoxy)nucleoside triphosphate pyrophosphohydrolase [Reinekea thalattae]|uniref:8-oxo-dGTP diphosphatase n=1 Tax=Reinekea thalattae TaxID=2593301 RepID=A0A5C8ZC45_9GAMM|nr:(deoxy)nucleoside triphosphate pyrophosphohydrolase [Reinekea thalattae]TXR54718.1 (deoxy)nucleoside triphosphate pyrophosphohydrolase [Reinekea thalattae]